MKRIPQNLVPRYDPFLEANHLRASLYLVP